MEKSKLAELKYCPYCFMDEGVIQQEFEIAKQKWEYYDSETHEFKENRSKEDDVIVFCVRCDNEILEKDVK